MKYQFSINDIHDINQLDKRDHAHAEDMLRAAKRYARMLAGDITFEEFKQEVYDNFGIYHLIDGITSGTINESNYISYIADIILDRQLSIRVVSTYPGLHFNSVEVLVSFFGLGILIDTFDQTINVHQGNLTVRVPYIDNIGFVKTMEKYVMSKTK